MMCYYLNVHFEGEWVKPRAFAYRHSDQESALYASSLALLTTVRGQ